MRIFLLNQRPSPHSCISQSERVLTMVSPESRSSVKKEPATLASTPHDVSSQQGEKAGEQRIFTLPKLSDFVDRTKPWVLVPDGSLGGYFDWVPEKLRHGPWSIVAVLYLPIITVTIIGGVSWVCLRPQNDSWSWNDGSNGIYPKPFSWGWCYNTVAFFWISFVSYKILKRAGIFPWAMYTLWSWTIIWIRHGLSALSPFFPNNQILISCVEYLRFPCLATSSITFLVWNFVLMPGIYYFKRKDPKEKAMFLKRMFSWHLVQLHILNICYAVINCIFTSPTRLLNDTDMSIAAVHALAYILWYLCVLDRIGFHAYPIFSPRSEWCFISWSMILVFYFGLFSFWNNILEKVGNEFET